MDQMLKRMAIKAYECPECYALLPYPTCRHECPSLGQEDIDEGFFDGELDQFHLILKMFYQRDPRMIYIVRAE